MASSVQSSESSSTSTPTVLHTPENDIIDQISGVASGLANQMLGWANGVFAQTSAVTNQAVGNFFNVSQQMLGLSGKLTDQYNNLFAPENAQLVQDANSYASDARMKADMGMAGATQAQAGDAALKNSEEALRSYGIDPSSGRYAALDKAAAVQNAANVAGAENVQRNADIATGQRLRSEAVQVGAQLPAAIANINNTAIQANTGASNASLANANTGRNLMSLPNDYLKTAMDVKLPPVGQNTQSQSHSNGNSSSPDPQRSGGGSSGGRPGGGSGGGGSGGPAWNPVHSNGQPSAPGGGIARIQPGTMAGIRNLNPGPYTGDYSDPTGQNYDPLSGIDANSFSPGWDENNYYNPQYDPVEGGNASMDIGQPGYSDNPIDYTSGQYQDPFSDNGFGQTWDYGGQNQTFTGSDGAQDTEWGNINYNPSANDYGAASDWGQTYDQPAATDWGSGADAFQNYDYSSGGGGNIDYSSSYDTSSPSMTDLSGANDGYDFAKGGAVPGAGFAGTVHPSMSPSGGRRVDDVPAQGPGGRPINLNAKEFVIPDDVATWKGHEFFQNLIDQSRKKRMGASAKPTPMRR